MMTRRRIDRHSTEFGLWLRDQKLVPSSIFDGENLDYVWFNYREPWLILIEEKRNGAKPTRAQQDTHGIVAQMLEFSSGNEFETMRGIRSVEYRGYFLVQFEKTNPEDSTWIKINGVKSNKIALLFLLRYGVLLDAEDLSLPPVKLRQVIEEKTGEEITVLDILKVGKFASGDN